MTLREKLRDWQDWDGAGFAVAVSLGIMEDGQDSWLKNKHVFWMANPLGDSLYQILQELVKSKVLEENRDPGELQYRWKN